MQIKLFLFAFVERKYLIYNYEKREHKKQKSPKIHQKYFVSLNKSLTLDHLKASSYGTRLIAILCLCVP